MLKKSSFYILVILFTTLLTACGDSEQSATQRRALPHFVETILAQHQNINTIVTRPGTLNLRRITKIVNQEEGRLEAIHYYEGDRVEKDALLIELDDQLLQAELAKQKALTEQAKLNLDRVRNLIKRKLATDEALLEARTTLETSRAQLKLLQTRLEFTRIRASMDGIVTERLAEPGDAVSRFSHLMTIADPGSLYTQVSVSELILNDLAIGDSVNIKVDALNGQKISGKIQRIHPNIHPITRQGVVEITLSSLPEGIRAGQLVRVQLQTHTTDKLMVPFEAVRQDAVGAHVFVLDEQNIAHRTPVITGLRIENNIEILDGLTEGQQIITRGFLGLTDGKTVTIAK